MDNHSPPPPNENNQRKALFLIIIASLKREIRPKFTVDKAPLSVDNLIKRLCNEALQRRFEIKQRHQKPLQGGLRLKQSGFASLQRRLRVKQGEQITLPVGFFEKHG